MNVELANEALALAREHQDRFNMATWWSEVPDKDGHWPDSEPIVAMDENQRIPPCGTVGCYAGFITFMTAPAGVIIHGDGLYSTMDDVDAGQEYRLCTVEGWAAAKLDITRNQAAALFYMDTLEQVEKAVAYLADNPDATWASLCDAALAEDF